MIFRNYYWNAENFRGCLFEMQSYGLIGWKAVNFILHLSSSWSCLCKVNSCYSFLTNISSLIQQIRFVLHIFKIMSDRRNQILQQFHRQPHKLSRSKEFKSKISPIHRFPKETFLTDTQTSDYTKSSAELKSIKSEFYEDTCKKLEKENKQLKETIIQMKATQFYMFNQEKIKILILQNQKLKSEVVRLKEQLQGVIIEKEYFERSNKNFKIEYDQLVRELKKIKDNTENNSQRRKPERNIYFNRDEEQFVKNRQTSNDRDPLSKKKQRIRQKKEKSDNHIYTNRNILKGSLSSSRLVEDYGIPRSSRERKYKKEFNH